MTANTEIRSPNEHYVICPNCCNEFQAIPVAVQKQLADLREQLAETEAALEDSRAIAKDWFEQAESLHQQLAAERRRVVEAIERLCKALVMLPAKMLLVDGKYLSYICLTDALAVIRALTDPQPTQQCTCDYETGMYPCKSCAESEPQQAAQQKEPK